MLQCSVNHTLGHCRQGRILVDTVDVVKVTAEELERREAVTVKERDHLLQATDASSQTSPRLEDESSLYDTG